MNNSSVFPEDYPVHHEESLDHHVIHSPGHENQPQNQQQSQSEPRKLFYCYNSVIVHWQYYIV